MVPTGRAGRVAVAKKIALWDAISIDDEQVEAAVDMHILRENLDSLRELPIPPQVKAEMVVRLMVTMGIIDPTKEIELDDGEKRLLVDLVREKAEEIAEQSDAAANALAAVPSESQVTPPVDNIPQDD